MQALQLQYLIYGIGLVLRSNKIFSFLVLLPA
jgi:hypothetical protein